tara:strand:- start:186 stop:344 length:159 start_codon:yes stop_codon:yes gene_type:complete
MLVITIINTKTTPLEKLENVKTATLNIVCGKNTNQKVCFGTIVASNVSKTMI